MVYILNIYNGYVKKKVIKAVIINSCSHESTVRIWQLCIYIFFHSLSCEKLHCFLPSFFCIKHPKYHWREGQPLKLEAAVKPCSFSLFLRV